MNCTTGCGKATGEKEPLPDELYYRLRESYRALDKALEEIAHPKE